MYEVYKLMLDAALRGGSTSIGALIKESMSRAFAKDNEKAISKFIQGTYNSTIRTIPKSLIERRLRVEFDEGSVLREAASFIRNQFSADVVVSAGDEKEVHDPGKKASLAQPYRPSIYMEG
jgi:hypothetical protein